MDGPLPLFSAKVQMDGDHLPTTTVIGARVTKTEDCQWHPKGAYSGLVYFWSYEEGDLCFVVAGTR